jgi:hypothetical protein
VAQALIHCVDREASLADRIDPPDLDRVCGLRRPKLINSPARM